MGWHISESGDLGQTGGTSGGSGLTPSESALLNGAQQRTSKDQPGGYAGLDANGLIASNQVPNAIAEQVTANYDPNDLTHAPNAAAIAAVLATKANAADVPDMTAVSDGQVPLYDAATGQYTNSGIKFFIDDQGAQALMLPEHAGVNSASVDIGDTTRLGEAGSFLANRNKIDGKNYFVLDYEVDPTTGSKTPVMMDVAGQQPNVVQPLFNTVITGTSITAVYTSSQMALISEVTFKVASNMTNVRMRVVNVATGKPFKHYPDKTSWYSNVGESWAAGDHLVDLTKSQIQIPAAGVQVRLELKADNISLRGDNGIPYLAIKTQTGTFTTIATRPWVQTHVANALASQLAGSYDPLDTTHALTGAATEARFLSAISQAQATRRQVGTWNANTNTPTLTDPPTTISGTTLQVGDYVEVSTAGTRFGITWAVGDIAKVVQTTGGALGWYKDPVQNDKFDSKNVWASQASGSDANSGSLYRPKQTLSGALGVVAQPGSIHLTPGSYSATALTVTKTNVNILGEGVNANNSVEIAGQLTTSVARLRVRNVNFTNGSGAAFTWADASGSHHLQDVAITTGQNGVAFAATTAARGFATITGGDFSGSLAANNVTLANVPAGTAFLQLINVANVRISVGTGWIVYVTACPDIQITGNTSGVVFLDAINVNAILTQQSQLTALQADTNVATDGFYICDFASPTVGSRNDLLLKRSVQGVATNVQVNRPYNQCPATVSVFNGSVFEEYGKKAGGWYADSSGGGGSGIASVTMAQRAAITTAGTYYNSTIKMVENYDGTSWRPLAPVNITELDPASVVSVGIYIIQTGVPASLPSVVQNGVVSQGDVFFFDGTNTWLLYAWKDCPAAVYINKGMFIAGQNQYQTLLKSNSASTWYYAPTPASRDTGILYSKKITSANGTPAAPYQMTASDSYVVIDDNSNAVGVMLPLIASVASTSQSRRFAISRPRSVSAQTVVIKTSSAGADMIVGGSIGQPNGETQLYLQPGESITFYATVDAVMGNVWMVESYDGYFSQMRYDSDISSSVTLASWGRYFRINANAADVTITLPFSTFGRSGSHLKFIRLDTNNTRTVTIVPPAGYIINGGQTSMVMPVGSSATFSIHTGNSTQIMGELTIGNTVTPQHCWLSRSAISLNSGGWRDVTFSSSDTGYTSVDPAGLHSGTVNTNRITIQQSGVYRLYARVSMDRWNSNDVALSFFINGAAGFGKWQGRDAYLLNWINPVIEISDVKYLTAGDYVSIGCFQNGSGAYTVSPMLTVESLNFQGVVNTSAQQSVIGATMARKQSVAQNYTTGSELTINYNIVDTSMDYLSSLVGVTYNNGTVTNTSGSTIVISVYTQNLFTGSTAGVRWCWLQKSDGTRIGQTRGDGNTSQDTTVNVVVPNLVMAPGESFYFATWQNSGVTVTVNGNGSGLASPNSGRMLITRVR